MPSRELMVLPYGDWETAKEGVWTLCFEVCSLALYNGEMSRLYSERKLMFDLMEASESSTQLRINEILAEMRRPVDEIQPDDLEDILKEITIQFSRLSTLASSMRRDHVKARGLLRGLRNLLKSWNERPITESLTNTSVETEDFENLMAPFGDFIERTEALMAQLNTVLDSVRTYLGIQQQKASIVEQTSSKEQLVRLVNLQEILHKLEVLIVAVYLTEMARIVFETLLQESANLLTTAFIPVSLLISVLISRMLHKTH
jgi:ABC-type transporter Mla subunit MlaD